MYGCMYVCMYVCMYEWVGSLEERAFDLCPYVCMYVGNGSQERLPPNIKNMKDQPKLVGRYMFVVSADISS